MNNHETAICVGMDALRIMLGNEPKTFTLEQVIEALRCVQAVEAKDGAHGEAVAWMWQHEETGRIGFVDSWQVENGWQKGNPRLQLIRPLYTKPQPADATTLAEAALYRDLSVQSVQMGYEGLVDAMGDLCKRRSQPADAGAARLTDQAIVDVYHKEFSQTVRSQDEAFIHRFARAIEEHITGGKP